MKAITRRVSRVRLVMVCSSQTLLFSLALRYRQGTDPHRARKRRLPRHDHLRLALRAQRPRPVPPRRSLLGAARVPGPGAGRPALASARAEQGQGGGGCQEGAAATGPCDLPRGDGARAGEQHAVRGEGTHAALLLYSKGCSFES